jgi:hypothetical protein
MSEVELEDVANGDVSEVSENICSGTLRTRDKISEIISSGRDESMACMDGRKMVCHSKRREGSNKGFELALYHCG